MTPDLEHFRSIVTKASSAADSDLSELLPAPEWWLLVRNAFIRTILGQAAAALTNGGFKGTTAPCRHGEDVLWAGKADRRYYLSFALEDESIVITSSLRGLNERWSVRRLVTGEAVGTKVAEFMRAAVCVLSRDPGDFVAQAAVPPEPVSDRRGADFAAEPPAQAKTDIHLGKPEMVSAEQVRAVLLRDLASSAVGQLMELWTAMLREKLEALAAARDAVCKARGRLEGAISGAAYHLEQIEALAESFPEVIPQGPRKYDAPFAGDEAPAGIVDLSQRIKALARRGEDTKRSADDAEGKGEK